LAQNRESRYSRRGRNGGNEGGLKGRLPAEAESVGGNSLCLKFFIGFIF